MASLGSWFEGMVAAVVNAIAAAVAFMRWWISVLLTHMWVVIASLIATVAYVSKKAWDMVSYGSEMIAKLEEHAVDPQGAIDAIESSWWYDAMTFLNYVVNIELLFWMVLTGTAWSIALCVYRLIKSYVPTISSS